MARARFPALAGACLLALYAASAPAAEESGGETASFASAQFGRRYVIADVVVRGNKKTATSLIAAEVAAFGLAPGATVDASDARVEAARYRLLALGFFLDVRLSVARGATPGAVVLMVDVEERGTLVINELFPSTSAATAFWGGADVSETNFLGRGINLGGGFVASTKPIVPEAHEGLGLRLRGAIPPLGGPYGVGASATALYNDGSEFYRFSGPDDDPDPGRFVAARVKRAGGIVGVGKSFRSRLHVGLDFRHEVVSATLPPLTSPLAPSIDFMVRGGTSHVGTVLASVELDTRSDPVLPRSGARARLSVEAGTAAMGSSYDFLKMLGEASLYAPLPHGHALGFHLLAGAITGDAPFFDRFFVGDLNLLLPRRALGINFATLPSRDLLDTSIAHHRYDDYAARLLVEYAVPIWRRRGFVYGGDAFVALGLLGMASPGDFVAPGPFSFDKLPIDLTGDLGLRLDTYIGIFTISIANALSRTSF